MSAPVKGRRRPAAPPAPEAPALTPAAPPSILAWGGLVVEVRKGLALTLPDLAAPPDRREFARPASVTDAAGKTWDREAVKASIRRAPPAVLSRMLRAIAARHEANVANGLLREDNGRGFFPHDGLRGTQLARQAELSGPDAAWARVALVRYAGQLLEEIGERAATPPNPNRQVAGRPHMVRGDA